MVIAEDLFRAALHLTAPWYISSINFTEGERKLDIWVDFPKGSRFPCPECNHLDCEVHDTTTRTWRHLDFFEHQTFLHGRIPRINCPNCGVRQVKVPWARERSGFTLLMEALIVFFAQTMQISQISEKLHIKDKRIWRVVSHYVEEALVKADLSNITSIGLDETSRRKGHEYITVFADINSGRVIFICKGKDASTLSVFSKELKDHNGSPEQIKDICCDMSPAFIKGITDEFPLSSVIFDKFHIIKLVNEAVDEVRRLEQLMNRILKNTRYIWLKNPSSLTKKQLKELGGLKDLNLRTVRAYNLKLALQEFWKFEDRETAEAYFKKWYYWATHSKLPAIVKAAKTLKNHWDGIISYFDNRYSNGLLEGLNSMIQSLKANARGYRNDENFMTMIYLRQGQLKLNLPT
jgi:transposase